MAIAPTRQLNVGGLFGNSLVVPRDKNEKKSQDAGKLAGMKGSLRKAGGGKTIVSGVIRKKQGRQARERPLFAGAGYYYFGCRWVTPCEANEGARNIKKRGSKGADP